jgi:hypothetical protein
MFDQLFRIPAVVARYRRGPMLEERLDFMMHLAKQGYPRSSLQKHARSLLVIAQRLGLANQPRKTLTAAEIKRKTANRRNLFSLATRWLCFMGRLQQQPAPLTFWARKINEFADYMEHEEGLSPETIYTRRGRIKQFFERLHVKGGFLHEVTPHRIDMAFQEMLEPGGYSRKTIQACATELRAFFRFAEARGWCRKGLATSIRNPRVFSQVSPKKERLVLSLGRRRPVRWRLRSRCHTATTACRPLCSRQASHPRPVRADN